MPFRVAVEPEEQFPEPLFVEMALGSLFAELERESPGITARCLARIERETVRASVVKLRGPIVPLATTRALDLAARWLGGVVRLCDAEHGPLVSRKRKKRR